MIIIISFFPHIAVPSRPRDFEIVDVQRTSISIQWKEPKDDGGSPITGYIIERKYPKSKVWSRVDEVDASTSKSTLTNLYEKAEYMFRVIAVNKIGNSSPLESDGPIVAKSPFGMIMLFII